MTSLAHRACRAAGWAVPHGEFWVGFGVGFWRDPASGVLWNRQNDATGEWLPVLDDPATFGCLLVEVQRRIGDPSAFPSGAGRTWTLCGRNGPINVVRYKRKAVPWRIDYEEEGPDALVEAGYLKGATPLELLVISLEAVPGRSAL